MSTEKERKSRVEEAKPDSEATRRLSEQEKQALEKSGEIEHEDGPRKEALARDAEK